jgi:hypothetical protein
MNDYQPTLIIAAWRAYRQSLRIKPTVLHEAAIERAFHAGWYAAADHYAPPSQDQDL